MKGVGNRDHKDLSFGQYSMVIIGIRCCCEARTDNC